MSFLACNIKIQTCIDIEKHNFPRLETDVLYAVDDAIVIQNNPFKLWIQNKNFTISFENNDNVSRYYEI